MESPSESEWEAKELCSSDCSEEETATDDAAVEAEAGSGDAAPSDSDGLFARAVALGTPGELASSLPLFGCCKKKCLHGKMTELEHLVGSFSRMTKQEKRCAMLSTLSLCEHYPMDPETTTKGLERQRKRFDYYLPFLGKMRKEAFMACYDVSHRDLVLARKQVTLGDISVHQHGNLKSQHTRSYGEVEIADWFRIFARMIGDVVPLRIRFKKIQGSRLVRWYAFEDHTLLPASLT